MRCSPPQFPPAWATGWGEDGLGLWLFFSLNGIRQMFRWIGPGSFLMGADEVECFPPGQETPHEVTLSRGFWLADTAVTQELWQAVMQNNPSGFSGSRRPVERVSWLDAQRFLARLNALIPSLNARLPFEAEWEYACRAGTTTPFSFGADIAPEQVNCNGRHPWLEGTAKGLYRRQTVAVKSLPANAWGLHEMHGNVWEWCQDWWQDELPATPATDPQGPEQGEFRVVRGGSWVCEACVVRSASRDRHLTGYSTGSTGLRLAA